MTVRIVCYGYPEGAWIFGKFADKMKENLALLGIDADIATRGTAAASVAHRIAYLGPDEKLAPIETFMITHLDTPEKIAYVRDKLDLYEMGVCMSEDHRAFLVNAGLPAARMCWISPGQDGVARPRPLVLGIASKTHPDGRKNEWAIVEALGKFPPGAFTLKIMGTGWLAQVEALRRCGQNVEWHDAFDYETYTHSFMPSLDYFLYFSHDEGSMAYLDAIACGVKTIVTPQGFHLDVPGGIDHVITGAHDLAAVLETIHEERRRRASRIAGWTWMEHAWRHLVLWDYLKARSGGEVTAEYRAFLRVLPRMDPEGADALAGELKKIVPAGDALLRAASLAADAGLAALSGHCVRQGFVYYPKNAALRREALALYPRRGEKPYYEL